MTPLEFLRAVWPDDGLYVLGIPYPKGGMRHMVSETIEAAAEQAASMPEENVYFAVHTFKEPQIWNLQHHRDKITKTWVGGWSVRTQENAKASRAFFFDLDVGEGADHFATRAEAADDLKAFCKTVGLP